MIFSGLCLLGAAFVLAGELLGWWHDAGEVALAVLSIVGTIAGIVGLTFGAGRGQVRGVVVGLDRMETKLGSMDQKLEHFDELDIIEAELNLQSGALERQVTLLAQIRDRL